MADPKFDLQSLRLPQDFAAVVRAKRVITTIPVCRPDRMEYVRVHPDPDYRFPAALLEFTSDRGRETYLVHPQLVHVVKSEARPRELFFAVTRQGDPFMWPVGLPGSDGRTNSWNESSYAAATRAMKAWVRVVANQQTGAYDVVMAAGTLPEPEFPDLPFEAALELAFRGRVIDDPDHPVLRKLRGEL